MDTRERWTERAIGAAVSLAIGILLLSSAPFWWHPLKKALGFEPSIAPLSGGCGGYTIYAQGRWDPLGAALRARPNGAAQKVRGFGANEPIVVNGWVHGSTLYPNNPAPFNNDIWFHVSDGSGWVSFGGVRAQPVDRDATDRSSYGGIAAPNPTGCFGHVG